MSKDKEVKHCEHIQSQQARPYKRIVGAEYDLVVCWKCQNESAPFLNKLQDLTNRLKTLAK